MFCSSRAPSILWSAYRPTEAAIRAIVTKFRTKFTLLDIIPPTGLRRVRSEENTAAVSASVNDDHKFSTRRRSGPLLFNNVESFAKGFRCELFKILLMQELKPNDLPQRRIFGEWTLRLFYRKIVFGDEAHFWLNGYINKPNYRFWSEE